MACILIADDNADIRCLVRSIVERDGHTLIEAANGRAAEAILETTTPDLLITDSMMPDFDGLELITAVRRRNPKLKVLAISGSAEKTTFLRAAQAFGANKLLGKPFRIAEFRKTYQSLLSEPLS